MADNTQDEIAIAQLEAEFAEPIAVSRSSGWDEEACALDFEDAISAIQRTIALLPGYLRPRVSAEIYVERKRQIAAMIAADFLLPSYSGAKKMHATMLGWEQLLERTPGLSARLLEEEIDLCKSLCRRSKLGIMPNERLVYLAYMQCNGKTSYGDMFQRRLDPILKDQEHYEREIETEAGELARALVASGTEADQSVAQRKRLAELQEMIESFKGIPPCVAQIEELQRQLSELKPYHFGRRRLIEKRIAELERSIASAKVEIAAILPPPT